MPVTSTWIKIFPNGNFYLLKGETERDEGLLKFETQQETVKLETAIKDIKGRGYPLPGTFTVGLPEEEAQIVMLEEPPPTEQFSIDSNLKNRLSLLTAELIDRFFHEKDCHLEGIGTGVIEYSNKYSINATYIVAHAILETGWGTSRIYLEKNNLFGYGAYDDNPYGGANRFNSREECIDFVMEKVNKNYLTPGGIYFAEKSCLGNKNCGMNVHYASDPEWGAKIASIARKIEDWIRGDNPPPPVRKILEAIELVNPVQPYYLPHDIGGRPGNETFCNWFVADVLDCLEIQLPRYDASAGHYPRPHPIYGNQIKTKPWSAEQLYTHFNRDGDGHWKEVTRSESVRLANEGEVVVASISGHIAIVIPGGTRNEVRIAQAGLICGKDISLAQGFGNRSVEFFRYVG